MTDERKAALYRDARTFTAGAACGFLAGAFVVAVVVWQFGNVIGSRDATRADVKPPAAVERWEDGLDDAGSGVIEQAPDHAEPTIGRGAPRVATSESPAPAPPEPTAAPAPENAGELAARDLQIPVEGVRKDQLTRQFTEERSGSRQHEALDILAPRNTPSGRSRTAG